MTKLITFLTDLEDRPLSTFEKYRNINEKINSYATKKGFIIKQVSYDKIGDSIIANILFDNASINPF